MANVDLIRDALRQVEDQCLQLRALLQVVDSACGDDPPAWVFVVQARVDPLHDAIQHLVCNLNKNVMPILADMSLNGGMGAVAPMVTKAFPSQLPSSRT